MNFLYFILFMVPGMLYEHLRDEGVANHWCYAAFLWSLVLLGLVGLLRVKLFRDGYRKLGLLVALILLLPVALLRAPHPERGFWIAWGFLVVVALIWRFARRCPECGKILRSVVLSYGDRIPDSRKKYEGYPIAAFECVWCWYRAATSPYSTGPHDTPKRLRAEILQKDRRLFARLREWDGSIVEVLRHFTLDEVFLKWWKYRHDKRSVPKEVDEQKALVDEFLGDMPISGDRFKAAEGCKSFRDLEWRKAAPERKKTFGESLVKLRRDNDFTPQTMAARLGLDLEDYHRLEAGELDSWDSKELGDRVIELLKHLQQ